MRRRALLATIGITLTAGCLKSEEDHAKTFADETDLTVNDWTVEEDHLVVEYQTSGSLSKDVEELATAYADVVSGGFLAGSLDRDLRATGVGASKTVTIEIETELAKEYNAGDISKLQYLDRARP